MRAHTFDVENIVSEAKDIADASTTSEITITIICMYHVTVSCFFEAFLIVQVMVP